MGLGGARDCGGLRGSFRKCDIFWEQTVEVIFDHSPGGKSFLQIVSRVERNVTAPHDPFLTLASFLPVC